MHSRSWHLLRAQRPKLPRPGSSASYQQEKYLALVRLQQGRVAVFVQAAFGSMQEAVVEVGPPAPPGPTVH